VYVINLITNVLKIPVVALMMSESVDHDSSNVE